MGDELESELKEEMITAKGYFKGLASLLDKVSLKGKDFVDIEDKENDATVNGADPVAKKSTNGISDSKNTSENCSSEPLKVSENGAEKVEKMDTSSMEEDDSDGE